MLRNNELARSFSDRSILTASLGHERPHLRVMDVHTHTVFFFLQNFEA